MRTAATCPVEADALADATRGSKVTAAPRAGLERGDAVLLATPAHTAMVEPVDALIENTPAPPTPRPVRIAVLTVSDSRTLDTDTSGQLLVDRLIGDGHVLADRCLVRDDRDTVRDQVLAWCRPEARVEVILITGGTGITGRDVTIDVLEPLFQKAITGFGELFRMLSYAEIGPSTIQSRASAGLIEHRIVFCLPGSTGACRLAWDDILRHQLDERSKPCNLVKLLPRLAET